MIDWVIERKNKIIQGSKATIREKAIRAAKAEIALRGKEIGDYTEDQLEIIVQEQESQIINRYKKLPLIALLIALGLH